MLGKPVVFISAVTSEFGEARERLAAIFIEHGATVIVQKSYPSSLNNGTSIQAAIDSAHLVVCLVGHRHGAPMRVDNPPHAAWEGCSWTQWEYLYARARAKNRRVFRLAHGENTALDEPQRIFRERLEKMEAETFGGTFFRDFTTPEQLFSDVTAYLENLDGDLEDFRRARWNDIGNEYRKAKANAWREKFPLVYDGDAAQPPGYAGAIMTAETAPFIASQRFSILVPGPQRKQAIYLRPAAFLAGRDSESEANARAGSTWQAVSRQALLNALRRPGVEVSLGEVVLPARRRLFLISGGGVGKTTNITWLQTAINHVAEGPPVDNAAVLALLVAAEKLLGKTDIGVLDALVEEIADSVLHDKGDQWNLRSIRRGLLEDAKEGRLVLLIDGLDHVDANAIPLLLSLQSAAPGRLWSNCSVIAAGRPHAIQGWEDAPTRTDVTVAASNWRFLEPMEFDEHEARAFLGATGGLDRFDLIQDKLGSLVHVPRVLEYVRDLDRHHLVSIRTAADIYEKATRKLIQRTLREGGERARRIGPGHEDYLARIDPPDRQVEYVMKMLAALAFASLCPTSGASSKRAYLSISTEVKSKLWNRMKQIRDRDGPTSSHEWLGEDLRALAAFASIIGNGLLDATDAKAETLSIVVWSNRTVQQFLAAYWLATEGGGFRELAQRLRLEINDASPTEWNDTARFCDYVFYPEADYLEDRFAPTDVTYELNQFLAEMPWERIEAPHWVAAAAAWYAPVQADGPDASSSQRARASEMLFRSWSTMTLLAGRPLDDWWDLPYDALARAKSVKARALASLHQPPLLAIDSPESRLAAATLLDRYRGDLDSILRGDHGVTARSIAQEMIAEENWIAVSPGNFRMGTPIERQGFPAKVRAYWHHVLDEIQAGRTSAQVAAERCTKEEWTTGAQGRRLRDRDIVWLASVFRQVAPLHGEVPVADRNAIPYQAALAGLEANWSRKDETPIEPVQDIVAFTMHRMPVLHRWFLLFSPGHRDVVEACLKPTEHPPEDHPATYISWYDAWAFCQWATWSVEDVTAPNGCRRYRMRLPHEPEWEYAARWSTDDAGRAQQTPYGSRYWWGDDFYMHDEKPVEESLSIARAHAIGAPGKTRAPAAASPNGLGFRDILGNVWEWMANSYDNRREEQTAGLDEMHYSRFSPQERPPVNCLRTMRGGLWYYLDLLAHSTARFRLNCDDRDYKMGFRVIREEIR